MKLTAVNNTTNRDNDNNRRVNNNQSFRGAADTLVRFWQFVDNGGRAMQFTVEDMFGTNLPRTYKGAMAGYKYTGKVNVPALLQEAIREFLTGPTMCIAPMLILSLVTKMSGKTADTHLENISNLAHLMENTAKNTKEASPDITKSNFYTEVVDDFLTKSIGKKAKTEDIEALVKDIKTYETASKKEGKAILSNIQEKFENIIKSQKDDYKNADFLNAKYTLANGKEGATKLKNYVGYITSFATDYTKENTKGGIVKLDKDTITNFKRSWLGKRALTIATMIIGTGLIMTFIPKIYTLASGSINPNAKDIYNEANKNKEAK